jgi:hypothetical protein
MIPMLLRPVQKQGARLFLAGTSASSVELKDQFGNEQQQQLAAPSAPRALVVDGDGPCENGFLRKGSSGGSLQDNGFIRKGSSGNGNLALGLDQHQPIRQQQPFWQQAPHVNVAAYNSTDAEASTACHASTEVPSSSPESGPQAALFGGWAVLPVCYWQMPGFFVGPRGNVSGFSHDGFVGASASRNTGQSDISAGAADTTGLAAANPNMLAAATPNMGAECATDPVIAWDFSGNMASAPGSAVETAAADMPIAWPAMGQVASTCESANGNVATWTPVDYSFADVWDGQAADTAGLPFESFVPRGHCSSAQHRATDTISANAIAPAAAIDAQLPRIGESYPYTGPGQGRTGASRRQRRKHRVGVATGAALVAEVPEMKRAVEERTRQTRMMHTPVAPQEPPVPTRNIPFLAPLDKGGSAAARCASPNQYWPATPESTPPQTPRAADNGIFSSVVLDANDSTCGDAIVAQLAGGNPGARQRALDCVIRSFWPWALDPVHCRVVQDAVEVADSPGRLALATQLRGHVLEAVSSPHANHVLQKCITLMPPEQISFVPAELIGSAAAFARHRYGCRVLERVIEHFPSEQVDGLVDEVIGGTEKLCRHAFGNFVVQHILEHGTRPQQRQVAEVLRQDAVRLAKHRVASHVVKAALLHCESDDKAGLVQALSADPAELSDLAHHHCGSFVVRELRRVGGLQHGFHGANAPKLLQG